MIKFTKREEELMDFLWERGEPATTKEMQELCKGRTWSDNYLHVMLRNLEANGVIECCGAELYGTKYARKFRCAMTKEEYYVQLALGSGVDTNSFASAAVGMVTKDGATDHTELISQLEKIIQEFREKENGK